MDKRKVLKRIIAIALIAVPFVLGFIGFADLYEDIRKQALSYDGPVCFQF